MPQELKPTWILTHSCGGRHEVKRSVFVAFAEPMTEPAQAPELLNLHRDPDARHHCWAWRCSGEYRFSDDGEPAGTAGRPILQAIEGADLHGLLVVVRRYFGGIKLGAGGLVRAYSAAATEALKQAQTRQLTPHIELELSTGFAHTQALFQTLASHQMSPLQHNSSGVTMKALVPQTGSEALLDEIRNQTRGEVEVRRGAVRLA